MGSSPHTRGALVPREMRESNFGIIPAYAGSTSRPGTRWTTARDHPRIRGEHKTTLFDDGGAEGSSPHTRGALFTTEADGLTGGIIPAYAGSTTCEESVLEVAQDHPRIRGEHDGEVVQDDQVVRIIPAYAGSTSSSRCSRTRRPDHPRIRGEHHLCGDIRWKAEGSSPHTRGAPFSAERRRPRAGIIPAYAGSTAPLPCSRQTYRDHPRIRGEHLRTAARRMA